MRRPSPHPGLAGRSLLTLENHTPDAVAAVLDLALALKERPSWPDWLKGRVVALVFERPSTRTRVSFESGIARLGGTSIVLSSRDMQMGRGETVGDTARVLSRMVDAIVLRTGAHAVLQEMDAGSDVPVVNGLTYEHHPCQALADALTLRERFGALEGLRVAYVGDGNNVCSSLMIIAGLTGMQLTCACPDGYLPEAEILRRSDERARGRSGWVRLEQDPAAAVADAHGIYTDTWVSMGDEESERERLAALEPYRVDTALMDAAAPDAVALHCLPAHHGHEITRDVLYGPRSAVWDQAENRMHAQAALLVHILSRSD
jgi:ornithine carbamoyltransferase